MNTYPTPTGEQSRNSCLASMTPSEGGFLLWGNTPAKTEAEIIAVYLNRYPHLIRIAHDRRALGNNMARLAYPDGISGADALLASKIGL